jgi:hypothetical protein
MQKTKSRKGQPKSPTDGRARQAKKPEKQKGRGPKGPQKARPGPVRSGVTGLGSARWISGLDSCLFAPLLCRSYRDGGDLIRPPALAIPSSQPRFAWPELAPQLAPLVVGGGQERGLRPGTWPVALVVALSEAADLAVRDHARRQATRRPGSHRPVTRGASLLAVGRNWSVPWACAAFTAGRKYLRPTRIPPCRRRRAAGWCSRWAPREWAHWGRCRLRAASGRPTGG